VNEDALATATLAGLGLAPNFLQSGTWEVKGGYVVAPGSGDIDEPRSLLHRRDRAGARELSPGFVSVDTGKYTLGPMLASHAIRLIARHLGRGGQPDLQLRIASA
jgi:hypothetical protein